MTWHKNANFQDEFFEGQYKLVGHRCLYIWYSVYFIFVSDSKLDATTDLDIYLKTLKMPQITDYHQKHLHFASFGKIEPLLKSSIKSEHIVFLLFSNIYFENLSLKGCKYTSTSTKTSINTSTGVDRTSSSLAQIWPGCIIPQSLNYVFWSQIMVGSIKGSSMEMGPWVVCYNQIIFMVFHEYGSLTLYVRQDLYKGVGGSTLSSHFYAQKQCRRCHCQCHSCWETKLAIWKISPVYKLPNFNWGNIQIHWSCFFRIVIVFLLEFKGVNMINIAKHDTSITTMSQTHLEVNRIGVCSNSVFMTFSFFFNTFPLFPPL